MNYRMVLYVLGAHLSGRSRAACESRWPCALLYGEKHLAVTSSSPLRRWCCWAGRWGLRPPQKHNESTPRDGPCGRGRWPGVLLSAFGALPFYLSREISPRTPTPFSRWSPVLPRPARPILTDVEAMSHGMLFWRSFSHWVGGMGRARVPDGRAAADRRPRHAPDAGPKCPALRSARSPAACRTAPKILYKIYLVMDRAGSRAALPGRHAAVSIRSSTASARPVTGGFSSRALSVRGRTTAPMPNGSSASSCCFSASTFNLYYFLLLRHFKGSVAVGGAARLPRHRGAVHPRPSPATSCICATALARPSAWRFFQVSSIITTHRLRPPQTSTSGPSFSRTGPGHAHVHRRPARVPRRGGPQGLARGPSCSSPPRRRVRRMLHPPRRHHGPLRGQTAGRAQWVNGIGAYLTVYILIFAGSVGRALVRRLRPHHDLHGGGRPASTTSAPAWRSSAPWGSFCGFFPLVQMAAQL